MNIELLELKSNFEVKETTTIRVSHQGKEVTFVAPPFGPDIYNNVVEEIDNAGLLRPTFAENISLIYSVIKNRDNKYAKRIRGNLKSEPLYCFNELWYKSKEGVFISDRNRKDIHVPFGFKTGENSLDELVKNPVVLALAEDEEGVEKLVEIAKSLKRRPFIRSFENVNLDFKTIASLSFNWYADVGKLSVGTSLGNGCNKGYAFGLLESSRGLHKHL